MKTLSLSVIVGSGIAISIIVGITIMSGILFIPDQNSDNKGTHGLPDYSIGLVFNGTQTSRDSPFYLKQGQNLTLVANVTSDPTNSPVSLDIDSHVGFTKTNGIDSKLSITKIKTPGKVMIYVSASKDATPNTYQILVKANNTQMTMNTNFYVKAIPYDENLPSVKNTVSSNPNPLGVTALVVYSPPNACLGMHCPPHTFYLKINSNSTAYLLGYDICGDDLCVKNDTLSLSLPLNTIPIANYRYVALSDNEKWNYGDTVDMRLEISSIPDERTAYFLDIKNSTIVP